MEVWGSFLESLDNQRARKAVLVYMQDRGFSGLASNMIKLSVNEAKWSSLLAGTFEKRAPGLKMGVEDEIFCLK